MALAKVSTWSLAGLVHAPCGGLLRRHFVLGGESAGGRVVLLIIIQVNRSWCSLHHQSWL
jgi:hypothetical protein